MKGGLLPINYLDTHSKRLTGSSYLSDKILMNTEFIKKKAETLYLFSPTVLGSAIIAYLNQSLNPDLTLKGGEAVTLLFALPVVTGIMLSTS